MPPRRGARCSGPAAARSMPRSRCSSCSTSSSRRAPASAAAPSWCIGATPPRIALDARRPRDGARGGEARPFLGPDGKPMPFMEAVVGGRSVGVPGTMKLLEAAHQELGQAALAAAVRAGDPPCRRGLCDLAAPQRPVSRKTTCAEERPVAARLFLPGGRHAEAGRLDPEEPGFRRRRCARIAAGGADAFYEGRIAEDIVATVTGHPTNPGDITADDLAGLLGRRAAAGLRPLSGLPGLRHGPAELRRRSRSSRSSACSRPATCARMKPGPEAAHWFAEAGRLAFADRALYLGDPALHQRAGQGPRRSATISRPRRARQPRQVDGQGAGRRSAVPEEPSGPAARTASSTARAISR